MYFERVSLDGQKSKGAVAVNISGKSDTRDNLLLFQKNIEAYDNIKNIFFSAGSWISPTNISFNLTFDFLPAQAGIKNGN